jgi:hypothetical protein
MAAKSVCAVQGDRRRDHWGIVAVESIMWSAIWFIILGGIGWLGTNFFATPLLDFYKLRKQVDEEVNRTRDIWLAASTADHDKAAGSLRDLGAKVRSTKTTASLLLRFYLFLLGYNLDKAGVSLIGLSDSLRDPDPALRYHYVDSIQVGLQSGACTRMKELIHLRPPK